MQSGTFDFKNTATFTDTTLIKALAQDRQQQQQQGGVTAPILEGAHEGEGTGASLGEAAAVAAEAAGASGAWLAPAAAGGCVVVAQQGRGQCSLQDRPPHTIRAAHRRDDCT
jgi:hypothetical protein